MEAAVERISSSKLLASNSRSVFKTRHRRSPLVTCAAAKDSKRGLKVLEWTGSVIPQGPLVKTAKFGWKTLWETFMTELAPRSSDGSYSRPSYAFNNQIGNPDFPYEPNRYKLYLGNPCPWCHRVRLALALSGLENQISWVSLIDDPETASRGGWVLPSPDSVFPGAKDLRQIYDAVSPGGSFQGRCTAPFLVDLKSKKAVCNDSPTIVLNLNNIATSGIDLRPSDLVDEIDRLNEIIYDTVNNGVYKSGFATTQKAYETAQTQLYSTLDMLETRLGTSRFLCGDKFTDADLRLFPTAVRFDTAYATIFKCSKKRWRDYLNLQQWLQDVYLLPTPSGGTLGSTVDIDDCRRSYFQQMFPLNPGGIVPIGPTAMDLGLGVVVDRGLSREMKDVYRMKAS